MGAFGYKTGNNYYLMRVEFDVDLLWDICIREIYILMKHYGSFELLKEAFENLKVVKQDEEPEEDDIIKCEIFSPIHKEKHMKYWYWLLKKCRHSFINVLESGYFLGNGYDFDGAVFLFDLDKKIMTFYDWDDTTKVVMQEVGLDDMMINPSTYIQDIPLISKDEIIDKFRKSHEMTKIKLNRIQKYIDDSASYLKSIIENYKFKHVCEWTSQLMKSVSLEIEISESEKSALIGNYDSGILHRRLELLNMLEK